MEDLQRLYPIGIQTFSKIREGNFLYVDKTEYVYRMTHSASSYMFLSRPRRFGKSLLTSTLHSYFSGREELFRGLAMEKLEKEWIQYPVLHFDMSMAKHVDKDKLMNLLDFMLTEHERTLGIDAAGTDPNLRLTNLIKRAYEQTGKRGNFQGRGDRYRNRRSGSDYGGGICEIYRQPRMGREKCQSRDGRADRYTDGDRK